MKPRHKTQPNVVTPSGKGKPTLTAGNGKTEPVDWAAFLGGISRGKTALEYGANRTIFAQGDPADSVWYLHHGRVKLAVTSQQSKEAIVSVPGDNEFFG
ncbi:MAG: cyclic nucleotide-binding domain-containing protein [Terriglobia bacterium]